MPARADRRIHARFIEAAPVRGADGVGVSLGFRPERTRLPVNHIDDFAFLGPELTIPAVAGLGKVLRILRSARISPPHVPESLLGREEYTASQLQRAIGTAVMLRLRPRSRLRFDAWTEEGVQTLDDVTDVIESPDAYLVLRRQGRFPVRLPRETVLRHRTECERWYEVLAIERQ